MTFTLTYSTMFDPPGEMHERFDAAFRDIRRSLVGAYQLCAAALATLETSLIEAIAGQTTRREIHA